MQQDKTEMQRARQLSTLRRVSVYTDRADICQIEREIIKEFLGVPYKVMGRSQCGLDCYGLILAIYKYIGYELFDITENYDLGWQSKGKNFFYENYYREWDIVENPEPFDVVLFNNETGIPNHGGVVLTGDRFIQTAQAGTTVARLFSGDTKKKIEGFYRLRERNDKN